MLIIKITNTETLSSWYFYRFLSNGKPKGENTMALTGKFRVFKRPRIAFEYARRLANYYRRNNQPIEITLITENDYPICRIEI